MSRANPAMTGPTVRDREADGRDEAAGRRDRSALARDCAADERDRIAQGRMQAAAVDLKWARTFLQAGAPGDTWVSWPEADSVIRIVLDQLDDALRDGARDRRAATASPRWPTGKPPPKTGLSRPLTASRRRSSGRKRSWSRR